MAFLLTDEISLRLRIIRIFAMIAISLLLVETGLELRHYFKGYDTLFFGLPQKTTVSSNLDPDVLYGPTEAFPFRSPITNIDDTQIGYRIWIASASHAEDTKYAPAEIFPALMCDPRTKSSLHCLTLNSSRAGISIKENTDALIELGNKWKPNIVLLYQNPMNIERFYKDQTSKTDTSQQRNPIVDTSWLSQLYHDTALYNHITEYLKSGIAMMAPREQTPPDNLRMWLFPELDKFRLAAENAGGQFVLVTVATSHAKAETMPLKFRLNMIANSRSDLDVRGMIATVEKVNKYYIEYAIENNIPIIDAASEMTGRQELFRDYVHFNQNGHQIMAAFLAIELETILKSKKHFFRASQK